MHNLSLKMLGVGKIKPSVYIDGKKVRCKKDQFGALVCNYQCDKSEAEVVITRQNELGGKLWLLMNMLFFVISFFGILEPPYDKSCVAIDCKFVVPVESDTAVTISVGALGESGKFATISGANGIKEISNYYEVDKIIKRRWRIQAILRFFLFVAALIGLAFILFQ